MAMFNSYVTNYQRVLFRLTQYWSEADEPEEKWHVVSKGTLECVLLEAIGLSDACGKIGYCHSRRYWHE